MSITMSLKNYGTKNCAQNTTKANVEAASTSSFSVINVKLVCLQNNIFLSDDPIDLA